MLRYEVRCWRDGVIPDLGAAVGRPTAVTTDPNVATAVLSAVASVPALVWGRDPAGLGDMWNSNSVVAWTLASVGVDLATVAPPFGGRAPGWRAGLVVAQRPMSVGG
jgi:hypothetical protein